MSLHPEWANTHQSSRVSEAVDTMLADSPPNELTIWQGDFVVMQENVVVRLNTCRLLIELAHREQVLDRALALLHDVCGNRLVDAFLNEVQS